MPILRTLVVVAFVLGIGVDSINASPLPKSLELKTSASIGGPVGLPAYDGPYRQTTQLFTMKLDARLRIPKTVSLGLEINAVIPSGFGINILIDVVKTDKFRFHIIDPGLFWNTFQSVSVRRVNRSMDITLGFGVEYSLSNQWSLTAEMRAFVPEPSNAVATYGNFALDMFKESTEGAQTCLGLSRRW